MATRIPQEIASASGLNEEDRCLVQALVKEWQDHYLMNAMRDAYYFEKVPVKDLGISVSPKLMRKIDPHIGWAGKAVDYWTDRIQYQDVRTEDQGHTDTINKVLRRNDFKNTARSAFNCSLRHCCSFITVTRGDEENGEPHTVVSAYPATAASALWDWGKKRIKAGLVVVDSVKVRNSTNRKPTLCYVLTDKNIIILTLASKGWVAEYQPHSMGRVPMEPLAYNATLERPFGRSRITHSVMDRVDEAQREMANMSIAAAFGAAPQKYLLGADKSVAEAIANTPFAAYVGSTFIATANKSGQIPQYGQLSQVDMNPHIQYIQVLASQFASETGVPLASLGVVKDNPSSAEAIREAKEDAIVDINAFINRCKSALANVAVMIYASESKTKMNFYEALNEVGNVFVNFADPAMPSIVSVSDGMVKQVQAMPAIAQTTVALRKLGYNDEEIAEMESDWNNASAMDTLNSLLETEEAND